MRYMIRNKVRTITIAILFCMVVVIAVAENTKSGTGSLAAVTTGEENVALGVYSLQSNTTGGGNTGLGAYSGRSAITVNGGIYLGYGAGMSNTSAHKLFINTAFYSTNGIFGDFSTGFFGINNTAPAVALDVTGAITASGAGTFGGALLTLPTFSVRMSPTSDLTDSAFAVTLASGVPALSLYGTDDDTYSISINTSDQAVFSGASGGYDIDADLSMPSFTLKEGTTTGSVDIDTSDAMNFTGFSGGYTFDGKIKYLESVQVVLADSTLVAGTSGTTYIARPVAAKTTVTLPAATVGLNYTIFGADTDSIRVVAATNDSLITSAGVAWKTIATAAGTVKVTCYATNKWLMAFTLGTWTPY